MMTSLPPSPPPPPSPRRINRAALDQIIRRAAELQTADKDIGDDLSPDEVLALGKEVGIPTRYLQQAMLEQQSVVESPDTGWLSRLVGPKEIAVQRVVQGDPDSVTRGLIDWMDRNELLVLQRQQEGRVSWEPMRGMQAAIRRGTAAFDTSKPKFMLARADVVTAIMTPLETGYCHVQLSATLSKVRGGFLGGAVGGGSAGVAAAVVTATLSPFWLVMLPPLLAGGALGFYVLRRYRPVVERIHLGLERALDHLERGGAKPALGGARGPGLLEVLAGEVRKAITSSSDPNRKRNP